MVAANVGGVHEVVQDGVSGFVVAPCDPAALTEATLRLLSNPVLRARWAELPGGEPKSVVVFRRLRDLHPGVCRSRSGTESVADMSRLRQSNATPIALGLLAVAPCTTRLRYIGDLLPIDPSISQRFSRRMEVSPRMNWVWQPIVSDKDALEGYGHVFLRNAPRTTVRNSTSIRDLDVVPAVPDRFEVLSLHGYNYARTFSRRPPSARSQAT